MELYRVSISDSKNIVPLFIVASSCCGSRWLHHYDDDAVVFHCLGKYSMNCQDLLWGAREYASNGSELCKNLGNFGTLDL